MKKKLYFRGINPRNNAFSFIALFAVFSLVSGSLPVSADPLSDTTAPIIMSSIKGGEQRNVVTFTLAVADENPGSSSIEILGSDDRSLSPRLISSSSVSPANAVLEWRTTDTDDGDYKVKYSAIDATGLKTEEVYSFKVVNKQPLVTLNGSADGRTISGSVSRPDSVFQLKIDGIVSELSPIISITPDQTGSYGWTLALPDTILDGLHSIELVVTSQVTGNVSQSVRSDISITTPLKVSDPPAETAIPAVISISDYAKEVGQFIAPTIPVSTQTQLFGVSTTDITENTTSSQNMIVAPRNANKISFIGDIHAQSASGGAPIEASESGWMFFGVVWYWWIATGVMVVAACGLGIRTLRRFPRTAYFGAESV